MGSLIVGVDLAPIKPIPRVITFQSDITTEKCRATIRQHLKTWKADTVLHDGAPNVGTAWTQDSFNQAELALQSMKLATEFLAEGGTFVTKVFRSKDYNPLLWVLNQLFTKVEATKPPSSRNVSAEIFVVAKGYKAPKKIDPRFLDPRAVFADLSAISTNNEAKVYNPEVKKRKRDGYEEGDYTLYKEIPASEFIQTTDPIAILGTCNKLTFSQPLNGDVALAALNKLPDTTPEIRTCCEDLKILGRKDFKLLLKWRLRVREIFGFATPKTKSTDATDAGEEVAEVEPMDEELKLQEDLQAMKDKESTRRKRERRKENERKQKEIVRMQMHMISPMDIGLEEAGPIGDGAMFSLKSADKDEALRRLNRGKMIAVQDKPAAEEPSDDESEDSDSDGDRLDRDLDNLYDKYRERKMEADAKLRAKKAREQRDNDEWEGLSGGEQSDGAESSQLEEEDSDSDSDDDAQPTKKLLRDLDDTPENKNGLSKKAAAFFDQDIFKGITDTLVPKEASDVEMDSDEEIRNMKPTVEVVKKGVLVNGKGKTNGVVNGKGGFEVVKTTQDSDEDDWEEEDRKRSDGRPGKTDFIALFLFSMLTFTSRHRYYHRRSHDDGSPACHWPKN